MTITKAITAVGMLAGLVPVQLAQRGLTHRR